MVAGRNPSDIYSTEMVLTKCSFVLFLKQDVLRDGFNIFVCFTLIRGIVIGNLLSPKKRKNKLFK